MKKFTQGPHVVHDPFRVPAYYVVDGQGNTVSEVEIFLADVTARTNSLATLRTYAYAVQDLYAYTYENDLNVSELTRKDIVNYLQMLKSKINPQRRHTHSNITPGSVNSMTKKTYLPHGYQPRTINLRVSVISQFYSVIKMDNLGPNIHPILGNEKKYHERKYRKIAKKHPLSFYQRVNKKSAFSISDRLLNEMRRRTKCVRDSALIECLLTSCGRAEEICAMNIEDVLWQEKQVLLNTKGRLGKTAVAVSSKFLNLLKDYLSERRPSPSNGDPLWTMERGKQRRLKYTSLRAVLGRLNAEMGTNITLHNFRSTGATKLAGMENVGPLEVQRHLRHESIDSIKIYIDTSINSGIEIIKGFDEAFEDKMTNVSSNYNPDIVKRITEE